MPHGNEAVTRQDAASELVDPYARQRHIRIMVQLVLLEFTFLFLNGLFLMREYAHRLLVEIRCPIHVRHIAGAPIHFCRRGTRPAQIGLFRRCYRLKELLRNNASLLRVNSLDAHI